MDVRHEIAKQVEALPPEMQERVLRYVASLAVRRRRARTARRQFASSLDTVSARQVMQAIEEW